MPRSNLFAWNHKDTCPQQHRTELHAKGTIRLICALVRQCMDNAQTDATQADVALTWCIVGGLDAHVAASKIKRVIGG
jgi:hypothetical protein